MERRGGKGGRLQKGRKSRKINIETIEDEREYMRGISIIRKGILNTRRGTEERKNMWKGVRIQQEVF